MSDVYTSFLEALADIQKTVDENLGGYAIVVIGKNGGYGSCSAAKGNVALIALIGSLHAVTQRLTQDHINEYRKETS